MACGSKTMPPTTWTAWEDLIFVIRAGRGVVFSFSLNILGGIEATDGELEGASNGERSFSLPSQRKVAGL